MILLKIIKSIYNKIRKNSIKNYFKSMDFKEFKSSEALKEIFSKYSESIHIGKLDFDNKD